VETDQVKIGLFYAMGHLKAMLDKGHVGSVRHYERYFDKVIAVYLLGPACQPVTKGNTTFVSLGTGRRIRDFFLAPYRLFHFTKRSGASHCWCSDIVYNFWAALLIKILLPMEIVLIPGCIPKNNYMMMENRGTLSTLPLPIERAMIYLSCLIADKVIVPKSGGEYVTYYSSYHATRNKLVITHLVADGLPTIGFYDRLQNRASSARKMTGRRDAVRLLYVGRFHPEKRVEDLINVLHLLKRTTPAVRYVASLYGDGGERENLELLAKELDVVDRVVFHSFIANEDLVDVYMEHDIFLSPFTGMSLREASLCGLPAVAYDVDLVHGTYTNEVTAILVKPRDIDAFAAGIARLSTDSALWESISRNVMTMASGNWGVGNIAESIRMTFETSRHGNQAGGSR
jgi:glycosyltransferase involved in cell wall biosynthesis